MSLNRRDLEKKLSPITGILLKEKGYICMVDVFVKLEYLTDKDVEDWRMKKVPYLEKSIKVGLGKVSFIVKQVQSNRIKGKLKASRTEYRSWGKGKKVPLRFSKSGRQTIEDAYSTHYLKRENA